ncbi:MAG: nuclear transport factor 2 family protein [Bacteroidota bacterium]
MNPVERARLYLDVIFVSRAWERLRSVMTDDCSFKGPFFQFESADEYIDVMRSDPPDESEYELVETFQNESSVCVWYRFSKPDLTSMMAQRFVIRDQKIHHIDLVFDAVDFAPEVKGM